MDYLERICTVPWGRHKCTTVDRDSSSFWLHKLHGPGFGHADNISERAPSFGTEKDPRNMQVVMVAVRANRRLIKLTPILG